MEQANVLDLHGARHHEVDRIVENFIFMNQDKIPLTIICGNSQKMIDIVNSVMDRHSIAQVQMNQYGIIRILKL